MKNFVEVISKAPNDVLTFLKTSFREMLNSSEIKEAILGNLYYETQSERFEMIIDKLKGIISA